MTVAVAPVNIAARLDAQAQARPDAPAVVHRGATLTFAQLQARCDAHAHRLRALGVARGMRTVLMVTPGFDFFALTFALFKLGAIPVLVDPGMGLANLGKCLAEARPEAFVGIRKAHFGRVVAGWGKASLKLHVGVGGWFPGVKAIEAVPAPAQPFEAVPTSPEDVAAILFTSGSTGVPKGAIYRHAGFDAQVRFLHDHFGFGPGDVDLPTFPLFALFDAALGVTAVIPEMDFTKPGSVAPEAILGPIKAHGVTQMFGSPALIDRVGAYAAERGEKLPSLRHVITAGAPVPPAVMATFAQLLADDATIHTPYGATEALPVASITHREVLGETAASWAEGAGTCVGKPVGGIEVAIIGISDAPIAAWDDALRVPDGQIGEIAVRGPIVSQGYSDRPDHDAVGKIPDPRGGVWHRMGDLGRFDAQGRIWFQGRKAHRVATADGELYTIPCEAIFNQHPDVRRSALVGVGGRPVVCVELLAGKPRPPVAALQALAAAHPHTAGIRDFLFHPSFPVDIRHNAKIFREKLAVWAEQELKK